MKIGFFKVPSQAVEYFQSRSGLQAQGFDLFFYNELLSDNYVSKDHDLEIISCFVDSKVTKKVIDQFPDLKLIAALSTGFDHIDLDYCAQKNITVVNVPSYGEHTVAEYAFALILALTKKICAAKNRVKEVGIRRSEDIKGADLLGKTLGVVGSGKIGKNVMKIGRGFDMNVLAYDVVHDEDFISSIGARYVALDELLRESDVVSLHVPYMQTTHHLLNQSNFGLMKKSAYLINTSRGGVVETSALYSALESGLIAGAGLDVLEMEAASFKNDDGPLSDDPSVNEEDSLRTVIMNEKIIDMPNVIVTPHNASNCYEALERICMTSENNIVNFFKGRIENQVKK